jgi:DNA-binding beta-propeller fold protein YncE
MVYRRVTLLWIATLVMGGVAFAHPAPAKVRLPPARHGSWMSPNASMQDPWLYVAGFNNGVVSIFDVASLGHRKAKLIGQIAGIPEPNGIKLDANGNLYVATYDNDTVEVFPPGATSPSLTLSQGLDEAVDVAVDSSNNVYVSSRNPPRITIFPPGSTAPSAVISGSVIAHPMALQFDGVGNLYAADFDTGVSVIPAGSQQPGLLPLRGVQRALGIAVDPIDDKLFAFVSFAGSGGSHVAVYKPGHTHTRRYLDAPDAAGDFLTLGQVGSDEYLFESMYQDTHVRVYRHSSTQLFLDLDTPSQNAEGVAFKPAGVP